MTATDLNSSLTALYPGLSRRYVKEWTVPQYSVEVNLWPNNDSEKKIFHLKYLVTACDFFNVW